MKIFMDRNTFSLSAVFFIRDGEQEKWQNTGFLTFKIYLQNLIKLFNINDLVRYLKKPRSE